MSIFTSASQGMTEVQESPGLPDDKDSRIGIANVLALKNRRVHRVTSGSPREWANSRRRQTHSQQ